jgi:aldehyde dehydrogenase (NAD+)
LIAVRQAYGVAGLITPWNFPIAIPTWKAAPALAVGNAVVMKPSGMAIGVAKFMEEIFAEHLPKDIFQVLIGGAECGQAVIEFSDVISFTGSSEVGSQIVAQAAKLGKPVQAEMGGQNPAIVLPDADLALTAAHLSNASMAFAGQKCTATSRIIVVGDDARYKEVCEALVAGVEKMVPNDPATDGVLVGPVISESAREDVVNAAKGAIARGGKVLYGASPLDRDGWFYTPTLICDLDANDPLNQEETFGPIAGVIRAKTVGDAITSANAVRFGLTGSVHGRDLEATLRVAQNMQTGMVKINAPTAGLDFHAPVGGTKDSSYGEREQGKEGLAFYSFIRTVTIGSGTQKYE